MKTKMGWIVAVSLCGGSAFASESVSLKCPAGSAQQLVAGQDVRCLKEGKRVPGPVVMLYPSGKKMAEGQTQGAGNLRTGTWTLYDEKGAKTHVIEFDQGDFHGKWTELHPTGQPKTVVRYERGAQVGATESFDVAGKPVAVAPAKR